MRTAVTVNTVVYNDSHVSHKVECNKCGEVDNLPNWHTAVKVRDSHERSHCASNV